MTPYKVLTVVGARPHFIKAASVCQAFEAHPDFEEVLVHTGQHYDESLSGSFFEELQLPHPAYNLQIGSDRAARQTGNIIIALDKVIEEINPDLMVVYGDTNTTAAGAIAAAKNNTPLAHIEAGLREWDKTIPEEVNKLLTDAVTDFFFSPTQTGVTNLAKTGITRNVYNTGDVGIDLIYQLLPKIKANKAILGKYKVEPNKYFFMTCHRAANTDEVHNLQEILSVLSQLEYPTIFAIHPRTRLAIAKNKLEKYLDHPHITTSPPLGFTDTQTLVHFAKACITDSGGIIKESYFHKTPAIIIDKQTEWIETVEEGWNHIAGPSKNRILGFLKNLSIPTVHSNCLGDGQAAKKIVDILARKMPEYATK